MEEISCLETQEKLPKGDLSAALKKQGDKWKWGRGCTGPEEQYIRMQKGDGEWHLGR